MFKSQRGISLIETTIGLSLVVIAVTTAIIGYNPERQKAENVLQHLLLVKAGMLRYNMDYPPSTTRLDNLLAPSENDQAYWNGAYVE